MKIKNICFFVLFASTALRAQVGIGTTTPNANCALEVVGNVKTTQKVFLETPKLATQINGTQLLVATSTNELKKYNVSNSKYGPVNFVNFVFNNLNTEGLQDFNTKIPANNYIISLQGYQFLDQTPSNLYPDSVYLIDSDYTPKPNGNYNFNKDFVNGLVSRAYVKNGVWWLQFYVNYSSFYASNSNASPAFIGKVKVNLTINALIFRKNLITSSGGPISVNMSGNTTATAAKPTGY